MLNIKVLFSKHKSNKRFKNTIAILTLIAIIINNLKLLILSEMNYCITKSFFEAIIKTNCTIILK